MNSCSYLLVIIVTLAIVSGDPDIPEVDILHPANQQFLVSTWQFLLVSRHRILMVVSRMVNCMVNSIA